MTKAFHLDIAAIRKRAKQHMESGAVTPGYKADRETVVRLLDEALATELLCAMRYKSHYHLASGLKAEASASEFLEHANEEQGHADQIAERIAQLGGKPNFSPHGLTDRAHAEFGSAAELRGMLDENLVAERIAIETYGEMIRYIGNDDPTTRRMLEEILATEEEHADDMAGLIENLPG